MGNRNFLDYFVSYEDSARIMSGDVNGSGPNRYVLAPAKGHSRTDRSLSFEAGEQHTDGLLVNLFCNTGTVNENRDYVFKMHGAPAFAPARGKRAKPLSASVPIPDSEPEIRLSNISDILARGNGAAKDDTHVAAYDYKDAEGTLCYQVRRYEPKSFVQFRPDGEGGWIKGLDGREKLPYHLDEIAGNPEAVIFIFEGEKDADRARADFKIIATTASGGAKWKDLAKYFVGTTLVIVPDHDAEGQRKARQAATALHKVAASVGIVTLPGLSGEKGDKDFSEWLDVDSSRASEFLDLCNSAPLWPLEGLTLETDFYRYLPTNQYICAKLGPPFWPASSVNSQFDPVEQGDKKTRAAHWLDSNRPAHQMTWAPGLPLEIRDRIILEGGWFDCSGVLALNLYRPPTIQPGNANDAQQWIDHIHKVYPDNAQHIIYFLAHRVQFPEDKINHALFLGGSPGIGKDSLLEPVKYAVGPWNVQEVSPKALLDNFNPFAKSVLLRISEARDLGDVSRYTFYDASKIYMASPPDVLRVNEKNIKEHYIPNLCAVVMTSNYKTDGLYLPADDRRHYVAWSDLVAADFLEGYWDSLWGWYRNGGFENVAAYLAQLDISDFNSKAPPPKTPAFWAIVDANSAPEEAELSDVLEKLGWPDAVTIPQLALETSDAAFATWMRDKKNRRAIPHRLERCGYIQVRNDIADSGLWRVHGIRQMVYAKATLTLRERFVAAKALSR